MADPTKTDNHDPSAKLALRRYFLGRYHGAEDPPHVLDCCQGSGLIWSALRREFPLAGYWGLDQKPKPGRLKIDSRRVLAQPGWTQNVVDIDTYGMPWKHWLAMLPNVRRPTTVFLTLGQRTTGTVGAVDKESLASAGLDFRRLKLPPAFHVKLARIFPSYCLARCCDFGIIIVEAVEAASDGNARYFGVRLKPAERDGATSAQDARRPRDATTSGGSSCPSASVPQSPIRRRPRPTTSSTSA
jgi:hypothetical protein